MGELVVVGLLSCPCLLPGPGLTVAYLLRVSSTSAGNAREYLSGLFHLVETLLFSTCMYSTTSSTSAWENCDGNKPRSIKTKNIFIVEASCILLLIAKFTINCHHSLARSSRRVSLSGHHHQHCEELYSNQPQCPLLASQSPHPIDPCENVSPQGDIESTTEFEWVWMSAKTEQNQRFHMVWPLCL